MQLKNVKIVEIRNGFAFGVFENKKVFLHSSGWKKFSEVVVGQEVQCLVTLGHKGLEAKPCSVEFFLSKETLQFCCIMQFAKNKQAVNYGEEFDFFPEDLVKEFNELVAARREELRLIKENEVQALAELEKINADEELGVLTHSGKYCKYFEKKISTTNTRIGAWVEKTGSFSEFDSERFREKTPCVYTKISVKTRRTTFRIESGRCRRSEDIIWVEEKTEIIVGEDPKKTILNEVFHADHQWESYEYEPESNDGMRSSGYVKVRNTGAAVVSTTIVTRPESVVLDGILIEIPSNAQKEAPKSFVRHATEEDLIRFG